MAIIELGLLFMLLYVCHRQHKRKKRQQALTRNTHTPQPHPYVIPIAVDPFPDRSESITVVTRQNSWKRHPYAASTDDEHETEYTGNDLPAQGHDMWRGNSWGDSLYGPVKPRPVGINPGIAVTHSDRDLGNPPVRQRHQPKAEQILPRVHHSSIITPSRVYLPFSDWRRLSEAASSPSVWSATLPVEADGGSDHRLLTPTTVARPEAAALPNQSHSWDATANEPGSYRVFVEPNTRKIIRSNPGNDHDSRAAAWQYPPSDGTRHSSPPPVPPKSPFRMSTWTQTTPNVSPLVSSPPRYLSATRAHVDDSTAIVDP